MSAPPLGSAINQPQPTPAPLQTGTPGTPVDAGQVQVTAKSNGSDTNARQFRLTSSAQQGARAHEVIVKGQLAAAVLKQGETASGLVCFPDELTGDGEKILTFTDEDDDGVEHNVQWRVQ